VPHFSERRISPRCDAVNNQLTLEFAVPNGRQRVGARLVNISRDGALIVTKNPALCEPPIWLRIESPVKSDWAEATIVRLGQNQGIALRFPRRCPYDLLLAGTIGIDLTSMIFDEHQEVSSCD
jgi:hypothetical protein